VSDSSQGPDWWRASDGLWYPPESYVADVARRVTGPSGTAGVQTTHAPTRVGTPVSTEPRSGSGAPSVVASSSFGAPRVVSLAALVLSMIGAFLPWATTDAALFGLPLRPSVAGVDLGSGQILCGVLAAVLLLSWWHLAATSRVRGVVLFASWLAALALSVYEMVDIIAVPTRGLFALDVGAGLYLCVFAALVGSVCSLTDTAQLWSGAGPGGRVAPGAMWAGGLVALGVVVAASVLGYHSGASPVGPIPTSSPERPFNGAGGPGPANGGTGSSGNTGNVGSSGDTGPSGTTGNSGNTGPGGGSGISGSGNSGPGFFGNSGAGGFGPDPFGNSGAGNSGDGGFGT
jgi:hypothetical protein